MKKLFVAALAVSALTFAACGNKTANNAEAVDSALTDSVAAVDTTALAPETKTAISSLTSQLTDVIQNKDQKQLTTVLANLAATYKAIVNSGKLEEALSYGKVIKNFVAENEAKIKSFAGDNTAIASLLTGIKNLPTDASTTIEAAKNAVSGKAVEMASSYLQKAAGASATAEAAAAALKNLPASTGEAVNKAVQDAKSAAETKVNEQVDAAKTKANEAVNNAKQKAGEAVNKAASDAAAKVTKGLGL